jgi:hypothetical protein
MVNTNRMAEIGLLIGEPARAAMLDALMDGRALTAGELAGVPGSRRRRQAAISPDWPRPTCWRSSARAATATTGWPPPRWPT